FREALAAVPGYAQALTGLCDVAARAGAWEEVEALARDAASASAMPAEVKAQLHLRRADAAEHQGRDDDAYSALLEADRLLPGKPPHRAPARRDPLPRPPLPGGGALPRPPRRADRRSAAPGDRARLRRGALSRCARRDQAQAPRAGGATARGRGARAPAPCG